MSSKTRREFEVTFWAKKRVKAFTHDEARCIIEDMKHINLKDGIDTKVTTNTIWDTIQQNLTMQISTIVTLVVAMLYFVTFVSVIKYIGNIPDQTLKVITLIGASILFLQTFRFPNTVGRWFDFNLNKRMR